MTEIHPFEACTCPDCSGFLRRRGGRRFLRILSGLPELSLPAPAVGAAGRVGRETLKVATQGADEDLFRHDHHERSHRAASAGPEVSS